ncbi:MAG: hypothetical protein EB015_09940 [Methylocystaceae bacterium]|nr:hypothetical protein [Methylocystaceae bacterium]
MIAVPLRLLIRASGAHGAIKKARSSLGAKEDLAQRRIKLGKAKDHSPAAASSREEKLENYLQPMTGTCGKKIEATLKQLSSKTSFLTPSAHEAAPHRERNGKLALKDICRGL